MTDNLHTLFCPKAVAVIGASTKEFSIGNVIVKNLIQYGFKGQIYPVNTKGESIHGLKAYGSVLEIPGEIDLVHIVIPPKQVPDEVGNCGKKGVKAIIINSAGFKEMGQEGADLESAFLTKAKKYNIRILGPNCQGIINSDPTVNAFCNFTFTFFKPGHISVIAQSGGVGQIITQALHDRNVGIGLYASNGNACDISIPEIMKYYGDDKNTKVILLCIESIADTKEFINVAKEVAMKKPVLAISSGISEKGAEASKSHTGGLAGGKILEVIFEKTGILSFSNLENICNASIAFASQPIPKGNRVGIITNTGGPAIIAIDELIKRGMIFPALTDETKKNLADHLLTASSISNPLDILATANASHFRFAMETLLNESYIDSLYITFVTPIFVDCVSVAKEIAAISKAHKKPMVCNLITDKKAWNDTAEELYKGGVAVFDFPETAAGVLSAMAKYNDIRNRKKTNLVQFTDVNKKRVELLLSGAKKEKRTGLTANETYKILQAYKIPVVENYSVKNEKEACVAAEKLGFPVVLKVDSPNIIHKSDVGGVVLNITNSEELSSAIHEMAKNVSLQNVNYFIQKFIPKGKELIIGSKAEAGKQHLLMFGMGGVWVDMYKDLAFELAPVTTEEADRMIGRTKVSALFNEYRGVPGIYKQVIIEILQRVSQLVCDFPEIKELDLNPLLADKQGAMAVDARIFISLNNKE